ncbi:MAG: hypothetical protein Q7T11_02240, partial [Deltaproteobacteria bacterium]|nr:hypothetical protein [Deltaproteobacteria bacterium]
HTKSFILCLTILSLIGAGCGGGSSDDDDDSSSGNLTIQASVAAPSAANLSAPLPNLRSSIIPSIMRKQVEEGPPSDAVTHAENLAGEILEDANGDPIEADVETDGNCELTGFTTEHLEAGVVLVTDYTDTNDVEMQMRSLVKPSATEITAAEDGTDLTEDVNANTDLVHAVVLDAAGGTPDDLDSADGDTLNLEAAVDVVMAAIDGDMPDDPDTSLANMVAASTTYALELAEGNQLIHDHLVEDLGGTTADNMVTDAGSAVEVSDITFDMQELVENTAAGLGTIIETYADPEVSTWETLSAGEGFDPASLVGCVAFLPPSAVAEFPVADLRAMAETMPDVDGGMSMMAVPDASNACAQGLQQGLFDGCADDPARCGTAFGTLTATFPLCPAAGCTRADFTALNFDPRTAGLAAANGLLGLGTGINYANFPPNGMRGTLGETFRDPTRMQSCANGGCGTFMAGLGAAGAPGSFNATNALGQILAPPGGNCPNGDADCLPCDSCNSSGVCTSASSLMGASCDTTSDCGTLVCQRFSTTQPGQCMCGAALPTGAPVVAAGGAGPASHTPPSGGAQGAACGTGLSACTGGTTCGPDPTHGTCNPATATFAPGAPCGGAILCGTGSTCTNGTCSYSATAGATQVAEGESCGKPEDCVTFNCVPSTRLCGPRFTDAGAPPTAPTPGSEGSSCGPGVECQSGLTCNAGTCGTAPAVTGGSTGTQGGGTVASGGACPSGPGDCQSGLFCISGTCQTDGGTPPPSGSCSGTKPLDSTCGSGSECASCNCQGSFCRPPL